MAGAITPKKVLPSDVQDPDFGYVTIFVDSTDERVKFKDYLGGVHIIGAINIQSNFYFVDDTIVFNHDHFYITQDSNDNPVINFKGSTGASVIDHGGLTGLGDDDHPQYTLADGTRPFTGNQSMGGNKIINLGAPTAATDAARLQDIGPSFYGIVVKDNSTAVLTDSVLFVSSDFDVDAFGDGARVQLDSSVARLSDLEPGFYGVIFKDVAHTFLADTLGFNDNHFYLTKGTNGDPVLNLEVDFWEKHLTVLYPNTRDIYDWFITTRDIRVESMKALARFQDGGFYPSITWTVRHSTDPIGVGTELVTGGTVTGFYGLVGLSEPTISNPNIPRDRFVWLKVNKLGEGDGTEKSFHVTLKYF